MPQHAVVSGLEALRTLRSARESVGVVILTANGEEAVILAGFEAGADDHVTKPFRSRVLLARIRAVLRRLSRIATRAALLRSHP